MSKKVVKAVKAVKEQNQMELQHSKQIRLLGEEIIVATAVAGVKYHTLCIYIRKNSVAPKLVTAELLELGFAKQRITEINRVSQAPDDIWNEFEAKTIGFRKVLNLARGSVPKLLGNVIDLSEAQVLEKTSNLEKEHKSTTLDGANNQESHKRKFEIACNTVLTEAEYLNIKSRKFSLGTGWLLTISKEKRTAAKNQRTSPASAPVVPEVAAPVAQS